MRLPEKKWSSSYPRRAGPLPLSKGLAHATRGADAAETKGEGHVGQRSLSPCSPPLGEPARVRSLRLIPPRRGRTSRALSPEARAPGTGAREHCARLTAAARTSNLTFTAVGVAPDAISALGERGLQRLTRRVRSKAGSSAKRGTEQCGLGRLWLLLFLFGTAGLAASVESPPPPPSSIRGSRVPPLLQTFPVLRFLFCSTPSYN